MPSRGRSPGWRLTSKEELAAAKEAADSEGVRLILQALKDTGEPMSPKVMADDTGLNKNTVKVYLRRLKAQGRIKQFKDGKYYLMEEGGKENDFSCNPCNPCNFVTETVRTLGITELMSGYIKVTAFGGACNCSPAVTRRVFRHSEHMIGRDRPDRSVDPRVAVKVFGHDKNKPQQFKNRTGVWYALVKVKGNLA